MTTALMRLERGCALPACGARALFDQALTGGSCAAAFLQADRRATTKAPEKAKCAPSLVAGSAYFNGIGATHIRIASRAVGTGRGDLGMCAGDPRAND